MNYPLSWSFVGNDDDDLVSVKHWCRISVKHWQDADELETSIVRVENDIGGFQLFLVEGAALSDIDQEELLNDLNSYYSYGNLKVLYKDKA